jgi:uncharacterized YccA/Bax inhibitor family protein
MFRTSNPVLRHGFDHVAASSNRPMTIPGTVNRTLLLLAILASAAVFGRQRALVDPGQGFMFMAAGGMTAAIIALILWFKSEWARFLAVPYAVAKGLALGGIAVRYQAQSGGLVLQAILLTVATLFGLLGAYTTGLIRATENFKLGVFAATMGILLVYLLTFILGLFGISIPYIHGSGWLGIGFSVFTVTIAALNLVSDFDFIENASARQAPKHLEWLGAFGLLVTLVWLYVEVLRLLSKLGSRD